MTTQDEEHMEAFHRTAQQLMMRTWHTFFDPDHRGWIVVDEESHTPLGWFFSGLHAKHSVTTHNRWRNGYVRAVEYKKAYWWAIGSLFAGIVPATISVVTPDRSLRLMLGGATLLITGIGAIIALTRFKDGE